MITYLNLKNFERGIDMLKLNSLFEKFKRKIKGSNAKDYSHEIKRSKKFLLKSAFVDIGKKYSEGSNENVLLRLTEDMQKLYCGIKKSAINDGSLKGKKFKASAAECNSYNLMAFCLGSFMEPYIENQKLSDLIGLLDALIDYIEGMIKKLNSKKADLKNNFMNDKKILSELKRILNIFQSHKEEISNFESSEKGRLKTELIPLSSSLYDFQSARSFEKEKEALRDLLNSMRNMNLVLGENLKEERIFETNVYFKELCSIIKKSNDFSRTEFLREFLIGFQNTIKIYRNASPDSSNYLVANDYINKQFFEQVEKALEEKIKENPKKVKEKMEYK